MEAVKVSSCKTKEGGGEVHSYTKDSLNLTSHGAFGSLLLRGLLLSILLLFGLYMFWSVQVNKHEIACLQDKVDQLTTDAKSGQYNWALSQRKKRQANFDDEHRSDRHGSRFGSRLLERHGGDNFGPPPGEDEDEGNRLNSYDVQMDAAWEPGTTEKKGLDGTPSTQRTDSKPESTGSPGPYGASGQKGEPGEPGTDGSPGPRGPPGRCRFSGSPGQQEMQGRDGARRFARSLPSNSWYGYANEPGRDSFPSRSGVVGPPGPKGDPGRDGSPGLPGRDGQPGTPGEPGQKGAIGIPGQSGASGRDGLPGPPGLAGSSGAPGFEGQPGAPGAPGRPGQPGPKGDSGAAGSSFVYWGQSTCPQLASRVYQGFAAAANPVSGSGGSSDLECLSTSPSWQSNSVTSVQSSTKIFPAKFDLGQHTGVFDDAADGAVITCIVCRTTSSPVITIPGRVGCPSGFLKEYDGYLMATTANPTGLFVSSKNYCVDKNPEITYQGHNDNNGLKLTFVQAGSCFNGLSPCTNYIENNLVACTVCTKN